MSQVGTGNQVLGDHGQRIEPNRVYSTEREREQIYKAIAHSTEHGSGPTLSRD